MPPNKKLVHFSSCSGVAMGGESLMRVLRLLGLLTIIYSVTLFDTLFAGVEMRLEAVADMGYSPTNEPPSGEICIRGPGLFTGYYNQPELTKECMGEGL
jgi:acyl-CoA synthetase (AMP-forming)/AMP-acid ligase II